MKITFEAYKAQWALEGPSLLISFSTCF